MRNEIKNRNKRIEKTMIRVARQVEANQRNGIPTAQDEALALATRKRKQRQDWLNLSQSERDEINAKLDALLNEFEKCKK